jgi:hypothetical protein
MFYCICGKEYGLPLPPFCDYCGSKEFVACYKCLLAEKLELRRRVKAGLAQPITQMTETERRREEAAAKIYGGSSAYICLGSCKVVQKKTAIIEGTYTIDEPAAPPVDEYCLFQLMDEWQASLESQGVQTNG